MSAVATLSAKIGHTRRFNETLAQNGVPVSLVGKEVVMVLVVPADNEILSEGAGVGFTNEAGGKFWWEVTVANLTNLGNPSQFTAYLTVYNADNSVFAEDAATVNVTY